MSIIKRTFAPNKCPTSEFSEGSSSGQIVNWLSHKAMLFPTIGAFTERRPLLKAIVSFKSRLCNEPNHLEQLQTALQLKGN